ncbi:outer membrane protein [Bradyrhizobium erythrophlei]|jgi:outer membrane immunogenic protein|uniref:Outer membrane immunogenic protein n=1 Tax=Bradyrhizobium erythrophlei TaxID=1437360 RepID=A0A1M7U085_9BRAD|nr:outer membrane protein [Bradyrhizobium erythrophlei]SHN76389.1 outer membrane immunogenic protein [Bradyrhizobium erythrophlei]
MKRLLAISSALAVLAITPQASAADLAARTAPVYTKAPEYAPVVSSWAGLYIGGNVGYGWGNGDMTFGDAVGAPGTPFGILNQTLANRVNGVFGGAQIGYNWQMGSIVTGLEADIQGSGIKGTAQGPTATSFNLAADETITASSESKLNWFGTVRGRLGVTVTPNFLLYGTGGLAYGEVSHSGNVVDVFTSNGHPATDSFPTSVSQTKAGWAAGVGAEWMFTRGWSAKVEYLHIDLGSSSASGNFLFNGNPFSSVAPVAYSWNNRFDTVRFGVNYHFN